METRGAYKAAISTYETERTIKGTLRVDHRNGEISRVLRAIPEPNGSIRWVDITHGLTADELASLSSEIVENEGIHQYRKASGV